MITFNKYKDIMEENLISSKRDAVWPSYECSVDMEKKRKESNFRYEVRHAAYEHMGHMAATKTGLLYRLAFRTERRNTEECGKEREQMSRLLPECTQKYL